MFVRGFLLTILIVFLVFSAVLRVLKPTTPLKVTAMLTNRWLTVFLIAVRLHTDVD